MTHALRQSLGAVGAGSSPPRRSERARLREGRHTRPSRTANFKEERSSPARRTGPPAEAWAPNPRQGSGEPLGLASLLLAAQHGVLHGLGHAEAHDAAGSDLDGLAGLGVAPHPRLPIHQN